MTVMDFEYFCELVPSGVFVSRAVEQSSAADVSLLVYIEPPSLCLGGYGQHRRHHRHVAAPVKVNAQCRCER